MQSRAAGRLRSLYASHAATAMPEASVVAVGLVITGMAITISMIIGCNTMHERNKEYDLGRDDCR